MYIVSFSKVNAKNVENIAAQQDILGITTQATQVWYLPLPDIFYSFIYVKASLVESQKLLRIINFSL